MSQTFIPMSTILMQIARDKGFDKIGRRRRVTVADLINMSDRERSVLARRLIKQAKA